MPALLVVEGGRLSLYLGPEISLERSALLSRCLQRYVQTVAAVVDMNVDVKSRLVYDQDMIFSRGTYRKL